MTLHRQHILISFRSVAILLAWNLFGAAPVLAQTWTPQVSGTARQLNDVAFLSSSNVVAVGDKDGANYVLIYSANGGTTWNNGAIAPGGGQNLESLSFSGSTIISVGQGGKILRSTDSGVNWTEVLSPTGNDLKKGTASFIGASTVVAVGKSGSIVRSTDSGASWASIASPTARDLNDISFSGATVVAVGNKDGANFTLIRSTDSGASWVAASSAPGGGDNLEAVLFVTATVVVAAGNGGIILRSTDGGDNWASIASPTTKTITALVASGSTVIGIGDKDGVNFTLVRSTDSGASFAAATTPAGSGQNLLDIDIGSSAMYAVGNNGTILSSTNGGASWTAENSGVADNLRGVDVINPVIVVGQSGTVLLQTSAASAGAVSAFAVGGQGEDIIDIPFGGEWLFALAALAYGVYALYRHR